MNNLKEIDHKNYLEATVVMLQSDKPSYLQIIQRDILTRKKGTLEIHDSPWTDVDDDFKPQHLYVLSNDELKKDDWIIWRRNKDELLLRQVIQNRNELGIKLEGDAIYDISKPFMKKVIASTDESLNESIEMAGRKAKEAFNKILPEPSDEFIKKYVESYNSGIPITNILVEYELGFNGVHLSKDGIKNINTPAKIKVDKNDKINITTRAFEFIKKYPKESTVNKNEDWSKLAKIGSPEKWMEVYLHYQELLLENDTREFLENIPKPTWDDVFVKISKLCWYDSDSNAQLNYDSLRYLMEENFNPPTPKNNN
jgi:hypothetical protein